MIDYSEIRDKIFEQLTIPYIYFPQQTLGQKAVLARYVLNLKGEILLISSSFVFSYSAILAGLTESHVEYIAKNAPIDYKRELLNAISQEHKLNEIFNIVKAMDGDMGNGNMDNQTRIKRVMQYVMDNKFVFEL